MTTPGDWDRVAVRDLYRRNQHAKELLDECASRGRNPNGYETTVDALVQNGWDRTIAIDVLRKLAGADCGEFKIGRRGSPSRLQWQFSAIDVGKDAQSANLANSSPPVAADVPAEVPPSGNAGSAVEYIRQEFRLRPDATAVVVVPIDMAKEEAERFAEIVKQTYFAAAPPRPPRPRPAVTGVPKAGSLEGLIIVPENFKEPLEEMHEYME